MRIVGETSCQEVGFAEDTSRGPPRPELMIYEVSFGKRRFSLCCRYLFCAPSLGSTRQDRGQVTTPSAALRWLRDILLMPQPPLLYQEGSSQPDTHPLLLRPRL